MSKTIWVLVELENDRPARSSLEVLGKAASLGRDEAIVLGSQAAAVAPTLGEYGAEKVYVHADAAYDTYLTLPAAELAIEFVVYLHGPLAQALAIGEVSGELLVVRPIKGQHFFRHRLPSPRA